MRQRRLKSEINVVPYIDVMLVLLVIFMVTTPMMTGEVNLPSAGQATSKPDKFIRIQVEDTGSLKVFDINGKPIKVKNLKALEEILAPMNVGDEKNPTAVLIAGDQETQYKNITGVLAEVKKLGFRKVGLETAAK